MKLKNIVNKAKQGTVSFFKDPKKVQGLAVGAIGMVCTGLLVNEVKTSKHIKEVKNASNHYLEVGIGLGVKSGNLDTLDYLNQLNKISKEEAILYGNQYDDFINYKFHENDVLLQHYNDSSKDYQEDFESGLN
jgi:hypothetical protein